MVELSCRASWFIVDSAGVQLEGGVGSINGNRGGSSIDCVQESSFRSRCNISKALDGGSNVGSAESAGVWSSCSVWVGRFGINSIILNDVLECVIHQTTITSLISFRNGAIDKVLLGQGDELTSCDFVDSFNASSGGEGPARSTLSLILNGSDGSFSSPVPVSGGFRVDFSIVHHSGKHDGDVHAIESGTKFFVGEIGIFIEANFESSSFSVPVSYEFGVLGKDCKSEVHFFGGLVNFVVGRHPFLEEESIVKRESKGEDGKEEKHRDR